MPERLFKLGAIGIVPSRKGFMQMLRILAALRERDTRYSLDVFGHGPEQFSWITRDRAEMQYYDECNEFIRENELSDHVNFIGFAKYQRLYLKEKSVSFFLRAYPANSRALKVSILLFWTVSPAEDRV